MARWVGGETEAAKAQRDGMERIRRDDETNAWDPRGGWLAGHRGTVRPDVCSASWVESTLNRKLPRTSEVRIRAARPPKSKRAMSFSPSVPTREGRQQGGHLRPLPCGPLGDKPLWAGGGQVRNHVLAPHICRPGSGRKTHREKTATQPEAGRGLPWPVAGAEVGGLPSCPGQDGTSESKQNGSQGQGLLGFLNEHDPGAKARNEGGAAGVGRPCGDPAGKPASSRDVRRGASREQGAGREEGVLVCHAGACAPARTRTWLRASLLLSLLNVASVPVTRISSSKISVAHNDEHFLLAPSPCGRLPPAPPVPLPRDSSVPGPGCGSHPGASETPPATRGKHTRGELSRFIPAPAPPSPGERHHGATCQRPMRVAWSRPHATG